MKMHIVQMVKNTSTVHLFIQARNLVVSLFAP